MQTKWYLRSFIILVAIIGLTLEQITQPNQQIVVEFGSDTVSVASAQEAMETITNELRVLGVQNIKVQQGIHGDLTITYYSPIDTKEIENLLFLKKELHDEFASCNTLPKNQAPPFDTRSVYKIDVHKIQKRADIEPDLNGLIVAFEGKTHRYYLAKVYDAIHGSQTAHQDKITELSYIVQCAVSFTVTEFSYKIPQVRAGPIV
jgi:hypothetical protein